jgi:hypothetical protein
MVDGVSDDNLERQSVYDYFLEKYNIALQYPNLLTVGKRITKNCCLVFWRISWIELYSPPNKTQFHYLPMECCTVQAWQRSIKPLTTDQRARVTKKTVVNPNKRYETIRDIVRTRNFNDDRYLKEIGMSVQDEEMVIVTGRLIAPPEIKYKGGRDGQTEIVERISIGKYEFWKMSKEFFKTFLFI